MNGLMKPIISGALIIALGVFLGAQRIAYVVSFEGRLESCIKTFNSDSIRKVLNVPASFDHYGELRCTSMLARSNN